MVLFLDNARVHKSQVLYDTARHFAADVLFSAEYSPWLQPIEQLFNVLKRKLRTTAQQYSR